jgi:hypothetical protein
MYSFILFKVVILQIGLCALYGIFLMLLVLVCICPFSFGWVQQKERLWETHVKICDSVCSLETSSEYLFPN